MKPLKTLILCITLALDFTSSVLAQPTNSPQQTFFQSALTYFSSVNTNFSFEGSKLEFSTGLKTIVNVPPSDYLLMQYNIKKFDIEGEIDNAGIGGIIVQAKAGIGYTLLRKYDTKLQAGLAGGYDFDRENAVIEPRLLLRKKATENTFFESGLGWPVWFDKEINRTPSVLVGAGFTF